MTFVIAGIITFIITLAFLVKNPLTQTVIARMAASYLSKKLNTEIHIGKLSITGLKSIRLTSLMVKDQKGDTLVYAGYFGARYSGRFSQINILHFSNLTLRDADLRIKKLRGSEESNLQFILDFFDPEKEKPDVEIIPPEKQDSQISFDNIEVTNSSFRFEDLNKEKQEMGVDFADIGLHGLHLNARNLVFFKDTFRVQVDHVSLYEKSGFVVDSLACLFTLSPVLLEAQNLKARTTLNRLALDFRFDFESMLDFNDFINKVNITASIRPSNVNLTEVGYFAPVMFNMYNSIRLAADIEGTVSNFKARDLHAGIGKITQFRGDVHMDGLPDIYETFMHVSITDFITTVKDVREFRLPTENMYIDLPEMLARFGLVRIKGKFTGFYNDFVSYATFGTGVGDFETDILVRVNKKKEIAYNGHLKAQGFNAGRFFSSEEFIQSLNLTVNMSGSGTTFENLQVKMDGEIDSLGLFGNQYNKINISGGVENKKFTGELNVRDENIFLDFNGSLDYGSAVPAYNFTAQVRDAYLRRINLIDRDSSAKLTTTLNINFMGDKIANAQGIIILDSTTFTENGKDYFMDDFTLSITRDSTQYVFLRLYSDILDATMEGQYTLNLLPLSIKNLFNHYLDTLIADISLEHYQFRSQDFIFSVNLKNTQALTELFLPSLTISESARFSGGYNERIGNLFVDGNCPEFKYNGILFNDWYFDYFIQDSTMQLITGAQRVFYSDTLKSDSVYLHASARNDSIKYHIKWKDLSAVPFSAADIAGNFILYGTNRFNLSFGKARFEFADTIWKVNPANNIMFDSNIITFENMGIQSDNQVININGRISPNAEDTLLLSFRQVDLSNFDLLLQSFNIDLDGNLNGDILLFDYYNSPFYLSDLHLDNFFFNGEKLGEMSIGSIWDPGQKAFDIKASIIYTGNIGKDTTLFVAGKYFPEKSNNQFDITVDLNKYKLPTLEPFTRTFSSDLQGMATGQLFVRGSRSKPEITGEINLIRTSMLIDFLNVRYYFADKVKFDKNRIYFENMVINDSLNNQAIANGTIHHENLSNVVLDINISTTNLSAMNTSRSQNDAFYGQILGSGIFRINGPLSNLSMDVVAQSEKGTSIRIPVSYGTDVGTSDYIVFVGTEEEEKDKQQPYNVDLRGLHLGLGLNITNDADIQLFMPYNMGTLRTRGKGDINMGIDPVGNFRMEGEYVIDRGSFFFTLSSILNRTFDIRRGSRVSWGGDPYNAQISIKAVYKVKTTLGEYGPPEDSATRVPVNCIIYLSNNLINPEITFSIEFPDLKEDIKQTIYSRLDTTDQAEMSRQMISLLVMNNFYQPTGFSGSVGFNTFDLVTNQLNNWLSQISNDFDIGVNYRPGDDVSSREVEVALSTQLFDERVLIDGNLGMRENNSTSQSTNNLVGEVTVEVKITTDGRFRARAFNKSNNNYLYKNYSPYTQGVGLFYTQEFNRVSDIFSRKKNKEKEKEIKDPGEEQPLTDDDTVKK